MVCKLHFNGYFKIIKRQEFNIFEEDSNLKIPRHSSLNQN